MITVYAFRRETDCLTLWCSC